MTIEERGRRAADELHRSVSAHLDVDRALDQVVGTGTPTGAAVPPGNARPSRWPRC